MSEHPTLTRRRFVATSAAAGFAGYLRSLAVEARAERKLNLAIIGAGGQGYRNLREFSTESIIALCDPDSARAAQAFEEFPAARKYQDFREMFQNEKEIDAVVVSTPDHN